MPTTPARSTLLLFGSLCCATPVLAQIQSAAPTTAELKRLSIEELMKVQVTSVSRYPEAFATAAAAVAVVTNEDIRRSGATTVPEALRLAPGIHVARQTSNTWAVSSRGFSSVNSEKLLVLSDTRSVYTPLFSGVFWDVQDYVLQDIDRIEVIRGPGATLWGSNAVNGVVNLITKNARDTQGLFVSTVAGTEERGTVAARYGGRLGEHAYYRVFGKYADRNATRASAPGRRDDWDIGHGGFRADWEAGTSDTFTLQGDLYRGDIGRLTPSVTVIGRPGPEGDLRVRVGGGNVLGRWRRQSAGGSDIQLRVYYDRTHRDDPSFVDDLDTIDVDLQHRRAIAVRNEVTWGANYRFMANRNAGKGVFAVEPPESSDTLVSGFVQDEFRLHDALRLTAGTKLEHNDFSGVELQPSGRIVWNASATQTVWGSVSRAARVPTRLERDVAIDAGNPALPVVPRLLGNPEFDSERLTAYEAGVRWQAVSGVLVDVTAFHNDYDRLASLELGTPFAEGTRTIVPILNENLTHGWVRGIESLVTVTPAPFWRLTGSSSYLAMSLESAGADLNRGTSMEGATPKHQLGLRSYLDLPAALQLDAMFRHITAVRRLPFVPTAEGVPAYAELDVRVSWHGWERLELSLVGQNLLHADHVEFGDALSRGRIERSAYMRASWGF